MPRRDDGPDDEEGVRRLRSSGSARSRRDTDSLEMGKDTSTEGIRIDDIARVRRRSGDRPTIAADSPAALERHGLEAAIILIAHPEHRRLGTRFRLGPGSSLELGRSPAAQISLPEVPSLSRSHALLRYLDDRVTIQDLGSRNGTFLNDFPVTGEMVLRSGDRFQVGAVHFKFLRERDVEHAYYEAIYEMVVRDGLTGAFNRRKFLEEAGREVVRAHRHGRPLALILIDIDHFKNVNDTLGHLAGDALLKQLASRLDTRVRQEQLFARLGGEEFAILSPETDAQGAAAHAEALRALCADRPFDLASGSPVSMTCSFGVAELGPAMSKVEELLRSADQALYRAKDGGRNRVVVAGRAPGRDARGGAG